MAEDIRNKVEEKIKKYMNASRKADRHRTYRISERTDLGIEILADIYSELYKKQHGIDIRVPKGEVVQLAVDNFLLSTIKNISGEKEKSE